MKLPWSLQFLGGLRATSADNNVVSHFRTQKTGSLLAYLATFPRHPHSREVLIDRFWPDDDMDAARQSLRVALASLRRVLEPQGTLVPGTVLIADRAFVYLAEGAFLSDAQAFEAAVCHAERPHPQAQIAGGAQIEDWEAALALYGGEFLPGYYDDWVLTERERLCTLWQNAHVRLAACCEAVGDWRRGLAVLDALLADGEENSTGVLWAEARKIRASLAAKNTACAARADAEAVVSPAQALLPSDTFCGRHDEIAQLQKLLADPNARLVTLTGPGGTGKTRLVLQTAALIGKSGEVPVYVAPLASLFDARRLPDALGDALHLPRLKGTENPDSAVLDAVIARLNDGPPALLVLDNFEQIAGVEAARTLRVLLARAPHITCFATSQRRVGVPGERLFAVPTLPLPDAVSLFCDRARAANPDFTLSTNALRADVEALCAELEGIPLAVELAAAWSGVLSPAEMHERLQERFALLSSRRVDKTDRHRSLWAAIAWSYDILPRDLRQTLARLSVFRGGWTMEAAQVIASVSDDSGMPESLARLCERSLLVCMDGTLSGIMRFGMLSSIREFVQERLSETEQADVSQKHAHYFAGLVEEAKTHLRSAGHNAWTKRLHDEMPNIRHALQWHAEHSASESVPATNYLLFVCAFFAFGRHSGLLRDAREHIELSLARTSRAEKTPPLETARASAINCAGLVAWMQGDVGGAETFFEQARAFWQTQNDVKGVGLVLGNLALLAMERDELQKAWDLCNEALPYLKQVGDKKPIANVLGTMGNARLEQERWAEGRAYHEESLVLYRQLGDTDGVSIALASLGYAAQHEGDFPAASAYYKESLEIRRDLGDKWRVAFSLVSIANLLWAQKNALPALTLYAATEKLRTDLGAPMAESRRQEFDEKQAAMRKHAGPSASDKSHTKGANMDYEAAVAFALHSVS